MSTATAGAAPSTPLPDVPEMRVAIVQAEWNHLITDSLTNGAVDLFKKQGFTDDRIDIFKVPGTVELTFAASQLIEASLYDAIIVFGCVIRGGTPHFDYVCQSITQGITSLNADCDIPVIFGVLTVDNEQDAIDRAGGRLGNKGTEAAEAAIKMHDFVCKVKEL
ncbi:MAG: 6,7-dimethyl-8-ribityllumazine synthase [Muribaculaceae bacterium]|nr:6,7-dimethyl-8-ribityllumazine synthase [Muribaculaceae bacterium]MDE6808708.1 6,7-dimethyl-8-ribityllumazine synthase [Muribaculaceae bacterium]